MKFTKFSLALIILVCAIGMVAAADVSNIKVADGYLSYGDGSYRSENEKVEILILDEKDLGNLSDAFKNNTELKNTVTSGKINNTFNFTDGVNNMKGVQELVKIGDKEYAVLFECGTSDKDVTFDKLYDVLEEFNKLNNLEPIDPSTLG